MSMWIPLALCLITMMLLYDLPHAPSLVSDDANRQSLRTWRVSPTSIVPSPPNDSDKAEIFLGLEMQSTQIFP